MILWDLADVCRASGLTVVEVDGWPHRSRNGNSFPSGGPTHIMVHHTGSSRASDGQSNVDYITFNAPYAPISQLYLQRCGTVWVCAGGAANTNGKGVDCWGGGVPDNRMNEYAIGIEAANEGTGEPWPKAQTDAYVRLVRALVDGYNIPVGHIRAHHEWSPGRKIDPAGQSPWADGTDMWNMDAFRGDVYLSSMPTSDSVRFLASPNRFFDKTVMAGERFVELPRTVPGTATGIWLNATVVNADTAGYLSLWGAGARPVTSCLNWSAGDTVAGSPLCRVHDGRFCLYTKSACRLILEVVAWQ